MKKKEENCIQLWYLIYAKRINCLFICFWSFRCTCTAQEEEKKISKVVLTTRIIYFLLLQLFFSLITEMLNCLNAYDIISKHLSRMKWNKMNVSGKAHKKRTMNKTDCFIVAGRP